MVDESSTVVKTTVKQYQKDAWVEDANELEMSQSEFIRTMVQAGRRDFDLDPLERPTEDVTPGVDGLKTRVLEALSNEEYRSFDEIAATITAEIERKVDDILDSLRDKDLVEHSNVDGGYRLNGVQDGQQ